MSRITNDAKPDDHGVMGSTVKADGIAEIDVVADPARLRRLDLGVDCRQAATTRGGGRHGSRDRLADTQAYALDANGRATGVASNQPAHLTGRHVELINTLAIAS
jgi:hypothetical protein